MPRCRNQRINKFVKTVENTWFENGCATPLFGLNLKQNKSSHSLETMASEQQDDSS